MLTFDRMTTYVMERDAVRRAQRLQATYPELVTPNERRAIDRWEAQVKLVRMPRTDRYWLYL